MIETLSRNPGRHEAERRAGSQGRWGVSRGAPFLLPALVALLALAWAGTAFAASEGLVTFTPEAEAQALARAARVALGLPADQPLTCGHLHKLERYAEGFQYDLYEVRDGSGGRVGNLCRVQVFDDPKTQLDLLLKATGSSLDRIVPVRPLLFKGKPFAHLDKVFAGLLGRPFQSYARPLSVFFPALASLAPAAARPPQPVSVTATSGATPILSVTQPELAVGSPFPAFKGANLDGAVVRSGEFASRRSLVLVGTLTRGPTANMLVAAGPTLAALDGISLLVVLADNPEEVGLHRQFLAGHQGLLAHAVLDPEREITKAFRANSVPCYYLFDKNGRLASKSAWGGLQTLQAGLDALLKEDR
jgi:hypothetical protein